MYVCSLPGKAVSEMTYTVSGKPYILTHSKFTVRVVNCPPPGNFSQSEIFILVNVTFRKYHTQCGAENPQFFLVGGIKLQS